MHAKTYILILAETLYNYVLDPKTSAIAQGHTGHTGPVMTVQLCEITGICKNKTRLHSRDTSLVMVTVNQQRSLQGKARKIYAQKKC